MDVDKGFNKIIENLKKLENTELQIGIFDAAIAEYATYNEYGNELIPARPFMAKTFERTNGWTKEIDKVIDAVTRLKDVDTLVKMLGEIAVNDTIATIDSNMTPKNAQSTIDRKGSSKTLIDTGAMKQSVKYELVAKNV